MKLHRATGVVVLAVLLTACGSQQPRKPAPAKKPHTPSVSSNTSSGGCPAGGYSPAQEDPSKRGNYKAGGLYAPGVADSVANIEINVDCIAEPRVTDEPRSRIGNTSPYKVEGKQYYVLANAKGYKERGTASYYGSKFHGRLTSNQEVYDMYAFTAAHKSLPLPSFAEVTNLNNGKKVIVRVNDRGPFHTGRVIDLSYAAAVKLGIYPAGTGNVEVRALTAADAPPTPQYFAKTPAPAPVQPPVSRPPLVAVAPAPAPNTVATRPSPSSGLDQLLSYLPPTVLTPNKSVASNPSPLLPTPIPTVPTPAPTMTSSPPIASAVIPVKKPEPTPVASVSNAGKVVLQVGSFSSRENADRALSRLQAAGIQEVVVNSIQSAGQTFWRVQVPALAGEMASSLSNKIANLGFGLPKALPL